MRPYSARRIFAIADCAIPDKPDRSAAHSRMRLHRQMLLCGILHEMSALRPSMAEIGEVVGTTHVTVSSHLERWSEIPWQDRYQWLRLIEGRMINEANAVDAALL